MGREKVLFKSEERKSRSEVAVFLREIADKLDSGSISLVKGQEELSLNLPEQVGLEVKVEEEAKTKTKRSLEIELEWYEGEESGSETVKIK